MSSQNSLDHPEILDRQVLHAGKVVFEEGDEGDCAYVIQSGAVDIVRDTDAGKVKLGRLTAGSIFGEMALIDDAPRMATAVSVESTTVVVIKRENLRAKIDAADPFLSRLLSLLVNNIRCVTNANVAGEFPPPWEAGDRLDLEYEPDDIAQALVKGAFIKRPADQPA